MAPTADEAGPSSGPHRMRITTGGSVQAYVTFALSFLKASAPPSHLTSPPRTSLDHPNRPLILHTLPPSTQSAPVVSSSKTPSGRSTQSTLLPCTLATPKLVSVAEVIKRAYIEWLTTEGGGKGKNRAVGIWQYTRSGLVPLGPPDQSSGDGSEEGQGLMRVLGGKTKPKMTHHPYLEITLSARPLGLESERDTTCQYLTVRRQRNRGKAGRVAEGAAIEDEVPAVGDDRDGTGRSGVDEAGQRGVSKPGTVTDAESSVKNAIGGSGDGKQTKSAPDGDAKKRKAALVASQEDRAGKRKKGAKSMSGG